MDDHYQEQRDRTEREAPLWEEVRNIRARNRAKAEKYFSKHREELYPKAEEYWDAVQDKSDKEVEAFKRKHNLR